MTVEPNEVSMSAIQVPVAEIVSTLRQCDLRLRSLEGAFFELRSQDQKLHKLLFGCSGVGPTYGCTPEQADKINTLATRYRVTLTRLLAQVEKTASLAESVFPAPRPESPGVCDEIIPAQEEARPRSSKDAVIVLAQCDARLRELERTLLQIYQFRSNWTMLCEYQRESLRAESSPEKLEESFQTATRFRFSLLCYFAQLEEAAAEAAGGGFLNPSSTRAARLQQQERGNLSPPNEPK